MATIQLQAVWNDLSPIFEHLGVEDGLTPGTRVRGVLKDESAQKIKSSLIYTKDSSRLALQTRHGHILDNYDIRTVTFSKSDQEKGWLCTAHSTIASVVKAGECEVPDGVSFRDYAQELWNIDGEHGATEHLRIVQAFALSCTPTAQKLSDPQSVFENVLETIGRTLQEGRYKTRKLGLLHRFIRS